MNYPICIKLCHCARGVPEAVAQLQPAWLLHQSNVVPLCHKIYTPLENFLLKKGYKKLFKRWGVYLLGFWHSPFFTKNSLKLNSLDHFVLCQDVLAQLVFEAEVGAFRTYIASHTPSIISHISTLFTFRTFSPFSHFSIFRHFSTFNHFSHFSTFIHLSIFRSFSTPAKRGVRQKMHKPIALIKLSCLARGKKDVLESIQPLRR